MVQPGRQLMWMEPGAHPPRLPPSDSACSLRAVYPRRLALEPRCPRSTTTTLPRREPQSRWRSSAIMPLRPARCSRRLSPRHELPAMEHPSQLCLPASVGCTPFPTVALLSFVMPFSE